MPIRHHCPPPNPFLSFLKRNDCILYSPLSQTDTTDWISGNQIVPYGNGSMTWDSARNIWKFQRLSNQPYGANQYYAKWTLKNSFGGGDALFTCCAEFYAYYTSDVNCAWDWLPTRGGQSWYGTYNQLTQSAQVLDILNQNSIQYQYRNSVCVLTYPYNVVHQFYYTDGVRIGCPNSSGSVYRGPFGVRNIAVFLKPFSLNDINEYFALLPS